MPRQQLLEEDLTRSIIGAFFEVYNALGFGFLEHLYAMALERELMARGHAVGREVNVPVSYKGDYLGHQRLDMIVDDRVVIEIKATEKLDQNAPRQVRSYLKNTRLEVGLLLHFTPASARYFRIICSNTNKRHSSAQSSAKSAESA